MPNFEPQSLMVKKSPIALSPQEHREDAPPSWPEIQDSLAESSGLALLLVDGHQPPAVVVSNNNSVCHTFQTSPEHRGALRSVLWRGTFASDESRRDRRIQVSRRTFVFCEAGGDWQQTKPGCDWRTRFCKEFGLSTTDGTLSHRRLAKHRFG